jgi:c-di-GMP-binding flagellar brake protein YcgR
MTAASASVPTLERRRERRIPIRLPIVVSGIDRAGVSFEERAKSENVCRGGVAFASRQALGLGLQLEIHIPVTPTASNEETEFSTQGRIVHVMKGRRPEEVIVGVEFTGPRFNRIFVSEATS